MPVVAVVGGCAIDLVIVAGDGEVVAGESSGSNVGSDGERRGQVGDGEEPLSSKHL